MKKLHLLAVLFLCGSCFLACNKEEETPESETDSFGLNEEIAMKVGGSIKVDDTDLTLAFMELAEDSRCPEGVECFWEGRAVVKLEVGDEENVVIELTSRAGHPDLAVDTLGNYVYQLLEVTPYPEEGVEIATEEYEIKVTVQEL